MYAPDKLTTAKIRKRNNSQITYFSEVTCDRVTILAVCTSSDGRLSMYQVSFNSLLYLQRYAPDKLFTANIKMGSNSVNTGDMAMVLAFCNSPHNPLSVYQVSLNYLQYFLRYAPDKSVMDRQMDGQSGNYMLSEPFGRHKNSDLKKKN